MKYIVLLFTIILFYCSNPMEITDDFEASMRIVPNLEVDSNGFYHMEVRKIKRQTLHRISLETNFESSTRIEWSANSIWIFNYKGTEFDVPIINGVSYTSVDDGTAQTMFAPVVELVGDTVNIIAYSENEIDSVKIILE